MRIRLCARRPHLIRINSVHQDDYDGIKGLYHINAVDSVTQWEALASAQTISEAYLLPVIEQMREPLPFEIAGFLADNCNEYINHRGAKLLQQVQGRVHPPPACALAGAMLAVPPTTDQCSV